MNSSNAPVLTAGEYLRQALERAGKTQKDLAKKLNVSAQFVSAIVLNDTSLPINKITVVKQFLKDFFDVQHFERLTFGQRDAVITKEEAFVEEFWKPIKNSNGTIFTISGKSLPWTSPIITTHGKIFLEQVGNQSVFIYGSRYEETAQLAMSFSPEKRKILLDSWALTTLQDIRRASDLLDEGNLEVRKRIKFYSLPLLSLGGKELPTQCVAAKFACLFHPLTATTIFEAAPSSLSGDSCCRLGYVFIQSGDHPSNERQFAWLRLSDSFTKTALQLIHCLLDGSNENQLLINDTHFSS